MTAAWSVRLAGLAVLALLIGLWSMRSFAPAPAPVVAPPPQIAAPEPAAAPATEPETEASRSEELEAAAWREDQLARLRQGAASLPSAAERTTAVDDSAGGAEAPLPRGKRSTNWERWFDAADFDESELLAGGMPSGEVERLSKLADELETSRTGITDRAEQEGWLDERRYRNEMLEFESTTRQKIGDDSYDALLYATGRENRVKVRTLLNNSSGPSFGLQEGDILVRYDGQLIVRTIDLRKVRSQGERGETVPLVVLRNDRMTHLEGPRGRLRARFQPTQALPDALW